MRSIVLILLLTACRVESLQIHYVTIPHNNKFIQPPIPKQYGGTGYGQTYQYKETSLPSRYIGSLIINAEKITLVGKSYKHQSDIPIFFADNVEKSLKDCKSNRLIPDTVKISKVVNNEYHFFNKIASPEINSIYKCLLDLGRETHPVQNQFGKSVFEGKIKIEDNTYKYEDIEL